MRKSPRRLEGRLGLLALDERVTFTNDRPTKPSRTRLLSKVTMFTMPSRVYYTESRAMTSAADMTREYEMIFLLMEKRMGSEGTTFRGYVYETEADEPGYLVTDFVEYPDPLSVVAGLDGYEFDGYAFVNHTGALSFVNLRVNPPEYCSLNEAIFTVAQENMAEVVDA